jgi:hypothetical protein
LNSISIKTILLVVACGFASTILAGPSLADEKIKQNGQGMPFLPVSAGSGRPIKDKWAVVVGVSKFKDPANKCPFGAKNARDFADYLVHEAHFAPDHVHLLLDDQATRVNIM